MPLLPYAAVDPRRLDDPITGGINTVTGQNVKTLSQTQATSPNVPPGVNNGLPVFTEDGGVSNLRQNPETGELYDPGGPPGYAVAPGEAGAGEHPDASTSETVTSTTKTVNTNQNTADIVKPRPNVLDSYSSYTYRASVYMMSPAQYKTLARSKKKQVNGYQLLFQSGGAPNNTGGFQGGLSSQAQTYYENDGSQSTNVTIPGANSADAGRNPAFPLDFYIDSVTIETLLSTRGTGAAHTSSRLKFTVIEPLGITLIDRIWEAAQDFIPKNGAGSVNYNAVTYLMVIKFYGYDENGKLITGIPGQSATTEKSDANAVIEKFIPFRISKLNWSITSNLVTYEFEALPVPLIVAGGTRRGTIPYDVQLNAMSLGELFGETPQYSSLQASSADPGGTTVGLQTDANQSSAETRRLSAQSQSASPAKANAAPNNKKTVKQGLMGAMNEFQKAICQGANAIFQVPDTYKVVWIPAADGSQPIRDATLVLPGNVKESSATGFSPPPTTDAKSADSDRVYKDVTSRNFSITAGMQMVQVLDLAIRNSSYILSQALTIKNTQTGQEEPNKNKEGQEVQWFHITFQALPKEYDDLRNDTGFDITFYISPFTIQHYDSKYFSVNKFKGVHKSYQYWFTGQNTAIIDYKEQMNNLYNLTVSGSNPTNSLAERIRRSMTSSMRDIPFNGYGAGSGESRQGTEGQGLEPAANISDSLYSPTDLSRTSLRIIGDPSWIQQGSIAGGIDPDNFNYGPWLPDGTINYERGQVMFEIAWQRPEDYDINTGLANPYSRAGAQAGQPTQSRVYVATKCVSEFKQGKFEQTIEGLLYRYPKQNQTNKAANAATTPDQSDAETARLARQNEITGRPNATSDNQYGASDYEIAAAAQYNRGDTPTLPAPPVELASAFENSQETATPPEPVLQPTLPPQPPTSGGVEVAVPVASPPPASVGRVTLEGLSPAPTTPQDISREA